MRVSTETPFIPASPEEQPPDPSALRGVFRNPAFVRLWTAQVLSSLGDWVGLFAILAIAARVSNNSATAVSLVMVARMLPSFFLATLGGVIVDRFDRRNLWLRLCLQLRRGFVPLDPRHDPPEHHGRLQVVLPRHIL